jgi:hypothetical protein
VPLTPAVKIWSYRARAAAWALVGGWSFWTGSQNSVVLVWLASLYANIATDLGAAQAADDREVLDELHAIREHLRANRRRHLISHPDPGPVWIRRRHPRHPDVTRRPPTSPPGTPTAAA